MLESREETAHYELGVSSSSCGLCIALYLLTWYSVQFYSALLCSMQLYNMVLCSAPLYSLLQCTVQLCSVQLCSVSYTVQLYSVQLDLLSAVYEPEHCDHDVRP